MLPYKIAFNFLRDTMSKKFFLIELLANKKQRDKFVSLEVKHTGSKDKIFVDHERGRKDYGCNVARLLCFVLQQSANKLTPSLSDISTGTFEESASDVSYADLWFD